MRLQIYTVFILRLQLYAVYNVYIKEKHKYLTNKSQGTVQTFQQGLYLHQDIVGGRDQRSSRIGTPEAFFTGFNTLNGAFSLMEEAISV